MKKQYDYLVVGSGLFGSVFAYEAAKRSKKVIVIDKRDHVGGNIYCDKKDGINIHQYGAHIFHTNNQIVWKYMNQFAEFNHYINSPIANYKGKVFNLPFNMNTFNQMWGTITPFEARKKIKEQKAIIKNEPRNLEEQAICFVGKDIYEKLIKGYTEKQWGRECKELPASIIKRLPVRYTYDNNYFNAKYQGIPIGGYNIIIEKLLKNSDIILNEDFNLNRYRYENLAEKIVYTGAVDAYFKYCFGKLEYRGLRFETERIESDNYQGVAVVNYTDKETPYTRIIEHKHFEFGVQPVTYITKEYPTEWHEGEEPYYPVNNNKNQVLFKKYFDLITQESNVIFGGRLAEYKYYDMDTVIESALKCVEKEFSD